MALSEWFSNDTEVQDLIYGVACKFFVGCEAPLFKDEINMDRFLRYLQLAAKAMGYRVQESSSGTASIFAIED